MKKMLNKCMFLWCFVFLVCFISSCKNVETYPDTLLRINSLIAQHPDSALFMLDLLDDFMTTQSEEVQVYHSLLKTKAQEGCHKPHTSDSSMKQVVDFYQKNGPTEKLVEAYFLLACVYRDLNDAPYALEYYQKATDQRSENPHHFLKSQAYNQIGALFTYQEMHFEAMEAYRKACFHAQRECDSLNLAEQYRKLAQNFVVRNKMDSAMYYYELAGRYDVEGTVHERIDVYIRQKEFDRARRILNDNRESYSRWGDYYHGTNKTDSASIYYQQALNDGHMDLLQRLNIYRRLALYAEEQGRIMQALVYTKKVNSLLDSLSINHSIELKDRKQFLYSRQFEARLEKESMIREDKKDINTFLWWLIGAVMLGGMFTILIKHHRRKSSSKRDFSEFPVCRLIKLHARDPNFKLNDEQWEELKCEMDIAFNNFISRLLDNYPKLNDVELRVCCLVKLKVSPKDIAHIVVRQKNTVSTIRERLYKKIHGEEGTSKQFDQFIEQF